MRNQMKERASSGARHEFDSISTNCEIEVRPAWRSELALLADMAHRLVPGVQLAEPTLGKYLAFDPQCILSFSRRQKLLGGMAFLYLNGRGHDALMLDEISLTHPDVGLLASSHQEVSAIYIWAIATTGRGIAGLGNAAAHLRKPRYVDADCFAHPSTTAGRDLLIATGFRPIPSFQPDLWCYERPWNRRRATMPTPRISSRSLADARQ
ncbi:MAG TPA: hypothetical protein VGM00_08850 [Bradyrhizobium sp.]|jgi:hypothetical protein